MPGQTDLDAGQRAALLNALIEGRLPDDRGRFGPYGGCYAPEILMPALGRLANRVGTILHSAEFRAELDGALRDWAGRPTSLTYARALSHRWKSDVWLKREDCVLTGAHTINNALGQAMLAKRLGATRIIAETGSGHHGVSAAAASNYAGLSCTVYMGAGDAASRPGAVRRVLNWGASLVEVDSGDGALCAALDAAFRDWVTDPEGSHFLPGSVIGPHPYPYLVRELQAVIGREARAQFLEAAGGLPDAAFACVGGGANALGLFHSLLADTNTELVGIEAGGSGPQPGSHAASLCLGEPGIVYGTLSSWLQDAGGQLVETRSAAAGMNFPGVGAEHALLHAIGRVQYETVTDDEALDAQQECQAVEGIDCALESAHALAGARDWASRHPGRRMLVSVSGHASVGGSEPVA